MNNSIKKMRVDIVDTPWGKDWVRVELHNSRAFYPSFRDLHRIIIAICECEDKKYPMGEGRNMVANFLMDACYTANFDELIKKYKIPVRD